MLAISAGGTIPDKGLYNVRTEEGIKLGEVDEEFVYESQKGDRFILGSFAWKVVNISRDTSSSTLPASIPSCSRTVCAAKTASGA